MIGDELLDRPDSPPDTKIKLQLTFKRRFVAAEVDKFPTTAAGLRCGQEGILDRIDLPQDIARRLMELGFLPGNTLVPARTAPGGGARVFRVDGSEVALRHDTAARLLLRPDPEFALPGLKK
jgi:ferrous iron transport protein A